MAEGEYLEIYSQYMEEKEIRHRHPFVSFSQWRNMMGEKGIDGLGQSGKSVTKFL